MEGQKNAAVNQLFTAAFVARPGFEPKHSESESDVLPLYYRAIKIKKK
jgi:hypothetical protein